MSHSHVVKNGKPGSRQTHLNREKFNPYRHKDENERIDQSILDTMTSLCCKRCCDIIQWKVDFGKYTYLERPRKCNGCEQKNIAIAYHRICQECAKTAICCAKCQKPPIFEGLQAQPAEDKSDQSDEDIETRDARHQNAKDNVHILLKYAFVNDLDSDEEFHAYRGLDIRRLKQYKKKVAAMKEKEDRDRLRERERRTILRKQRKLKGGEPNQSDGDDSDELM